MDNIREMNINDVDAVAKIHVASFPGFFLTYMGENFLRGFYRSVLLDEAKIALVFDDQVIQAFVVGSTQPDGFYKRTIARFGYRYILASIGAVLHRPAIAIQIARRFFVTQQAIFQPGEALLMSVAVSPLKQGHGLGQKLVGRFLLEAFDKKAELVSLVTDKLDNQRTNDFYLNLGFQCVRSFVTAEGRHMNEYYYYRDSSLNCH